MSDNTFKQRFRKSLLFLSGLVGKECVEIRPVSTADGQPTRQQAEAASLCGYNAALICSFINNPAVQAEKPSCEICYNDWLLPESRVCRRKCYGGSRAASVWPLLSSRQRAQSQCSFQIRFQTCLFKQTAWSDSGLENHRIIKIGKHL